MTFDSVFTAFPELEADGLHLRQVTIANTESLLTAIDFEFEKGCLNRTEALVVAGNVGSIRLLEMLGFRHEGILQEYGKQGG